MQAPPAKTVTQFNHGQTKKKVNTSVCCSVSQRVEKVCENVVSWLRVSKRVAVSCSVVRCVAVCTVCCSVLQCAAVCCSVSSRYMTMLYRGYMFLNVLRCVAV